MPIPDNDVDIEKVPSVIVEVVVVDIDIVPSDVAIDVDIGDVPVVVLLYSISSQARLSDGSPMDGYSSSAYGQSTFLSLKYIFSQNFQYFVIFKFFLNVCHFHEN